MFSFPPELAEMAKRQKFSFPIAAILLSMTAVSLLFSSGLSFMFLLLLTELIVISVCVELLTRQMPHTLLSLSKANCYRLDGTRYAKPGIGSP
jgi:hypothetical protein